MKTRLPLALAIALLLGACASPPPDYFYTLDATTPVMNQASSNAASSPIRVGPVSVPELVDRPQLVLRTGSNEVSLAEHRRWAESLRSAIARVVTANLSATGAPAGTTVAIEVQRFESQLDVAIELEARWRIRAAAGSVREGSLRWREPVAGPGYAALAAAHSRALAELSRQIALGLDNFVDSKQQAPPQSAAR